MDMNMRKGLTSRDPRIEPQLVAIRLWAQSFVEQTLHLVDRDIIAACSESDASNYVAISRLVITSVVTRK
jgi:hypothetical protein